MPPQKPSTGIPGRPVVASPTPTPLATNDTDAATSQTKNRTSGTCSICYEQESQIAILGFEPCNHTDLCFNCVAKHLRATPMGEKPNCPFCRREIKKIFRLDVDDNDTSDNADDNTQKTKDTASTSLARLFISIGNFVMGLMSFELLERDVAAKAFTPILMKDLMPVIIAAGIDGLDYFEHKKLQKSLTGHVRPAEKANLMKVISRFLVWETAWRDFLYGPFFLWKWNCVMECSDASDAEPETSPSSLPSTQANNRKSSFSPFLTWNWDLVIMFSTDSDDDSDDDSDQDSEDGSEDDSEDGSEQDSDGEADGEGESDSNSEDTAPGDSDAGNPLSSQLHPNIQLPVNLHSEHQPTATECRSCKASFEGEEGEAILGFTPCEHKDMCWNCVMLHVGSTFGTTPRCPHCHSKIENIFIVETDQPKNFIAVDDCYEGLLAFVELEQAVNTDQIEPIPWVIVMCIYRQAGIKSLEDYEEHKLDAELKKLGLEKEADNIKKVTGFFLRLRAAWKGFADGYVCEKWDQIMGKPSAESDEEEEEIKNEGD